MRGYTDNIRIREVKLAYLEKILPPISKAFGACHTKVRLGSQLHVHVYPLEMKAQFYTKMKKKLTLEFSVRLSRGTACIHAFLSLSSLGNVNTCTFVSAV